jgi:hypothetical protein
VFYLGAPWFHEGGLVSKIVQSILLS